MSKICFQKHFTGKQYYLHNNYAILSIYQRYVLSLFFASYFFSLAQFGISLGLPVMVLDLPKSYPIGKDYRQKAFFRLMCKIADKLLINCRYKGNFR